MTHEQNQSSPLPKIEVDRKTKMAYRVAYECKVGPIPAGLEIDHLCRTPLCVNPLHLEPVTQRENILRHTRLITECKHGHAYTPENTLIVKRKDRNGAPQRRCRQCERHKCERRKTQRRKGKTI